MHATATYHDSCAGLRELGVKAQPRKLLAAVDGLKLAEMEGAETCCGFGGTFCVKYPAISNAIVFGKDRERRRVRSGPPSRRRSRLSMNMAGRLHREGRTARAYHAAEVLAGMGDGPAIGEEP